jgi:peroxiredoxin
MSALQPGTKAPQFTLRGRDASVRAPIPDTLTLLFFYKVTCPTCQLAAPYISRFRPYEERGAFKILAIAQDSGEEARAFESVYGLTVQSLSDETPYSVSSQFGLTSVPTTFLISDDGAILHTQEGFSKPGYNAISDTIAAELGCEALLVAPPDDGAPMFKPG